MGDTPESESRNGQSREQKIQSLMGDLIVQNDGYEGALFEAVISTGKGEHILLFPNSNYGVDSRKGLVELEPGFCNAIRQSQDAGGPEAILKGWLGDPSHLIVNDGKFSQWKEAYTRARSRAEDVVRSVHYLDEAVKLVAESETQADTQQPTATPDNSGS